MAAADAICGSSTWALDDNTLAPQMPHRVKSRGRAAPKRAAARARWSDMCEDELDDLWPQPPFLTLPSPVWAVDYSEAQQPEAPFPRAFYCGPSPTLAWATYLAWASQRECEEIPEYLFQVLSFFVWLVLSGSCPESFLTALQIMLRRTLPGAIKLPGWVGRMVYVLSFV